MEKSFVNRIEEIKYLRQALRYDGKECPALVFTGIGGMGKTALRQAFEKHFLKPKRVPYAVLDYDGDPNLLPIESSLRAIRRQLGRCKVKTPVFDFLFARYFELSMGIKLTAKNYPPELEGVANILDGIPTVGNISQIIFGLTRLGLRVKKRVQHKKWLYRLRELEPKEILNILPEALAEDLEEAMSSQIPKILKTSNFRIALLLDAYELLAESQYDDTLHRKLLLLSPHLLRVIFTRDPLAWGHKHPKEWQGKITHFPPLEDLSLEDAKLLLRKKSLDSPDLQEYLCHLTNGYPFHLELCIDICREIEESTGKKPQIQDFEGPAKAANLTEELINRLLRQLKDDERDLMGLAAYPRWISKEVVEVLSSVPEGVPRIFRKFKRLSMFSSHPEIPEAYVLRKEVRDCLLKQQRRKRFWKKYHVKLSQFHRECWEDTKLFYHLREALYHRFYENPEEAMKMFEEHFWKLLKKFKFGEAESLLGSVPEEKLSKEQKRKVKYARARLLTLGMRSQESLIAAKHLYEKLVTSEVDKENLSKYLFDLSENMYIFGEYEKALKYCLKSLTIQLKILGKEHGDVARTYNSIGILCREQGEYTKALEYFKAALSIRLKVLGNKHPDVARTYNSIGVVYSCQSKLGKALEYYQMALTIRLRVFGEEHPDVAGSYHNIGNIYDEQGEYGKALEYYQKALAIRLKLYGNEHLDVARVYHNIGYVYSEQAENAKALEYSENALSIYKKVYGEEHPDIAGVYNNIGSIYKNQSEYKRTLEYYQKSLDMRLNIYGKEHPKVAASYNNIGTIYKERGEFVKAMEYHRKALAIRLKVYGEEHPQVATSYDNIGNSYCNQGNCRKALEYHQISLDIWLKVYGEKHPDVAICFYNIGCTYFAQAKYEKALKFYQKSLNILLKVFREEHPDIANSCEGIASSLWALKRGDEAFERIKKSIKIYRKFRLWKDVLKCLETLMGWLVEMGRRKEAEEAGKEAERIRKEHGFS